MPEIVAVTGTDGSGKTTLINAVVETTRQSLPTGTVGSLGDVSTFRYKKTDIFLSPDTTRRIRLLYDQGKHHQSKFMILGAMTLHSLFTGRVIEPKLRKMGTSLYFRDREPILDSICLFQAYTDLPVPPTALLLAIKLASAPRRTDLLFLLEIDPTIALARSKSQANPDPHERPDRLKRAQRTCGHLLSNPMMQNQISQVVTIDTGANDLAYCTHQILDSLHQKLELPVFN